MTGLKTGFHFDKNISKGGVLAARECKTLPLLGRCTVFGDLRVLRRVPANRHLIAAFRFCNQQSLICPVNNI